MKSFEIDPAVRLANETRRRGQMLVVTDRASWRVDYCGALNEIGMFRLFRRSKDQSDFQEQPQTFPGDPTGMRAVRAHIESQDVQGLGGDPRSWCIHFMECEDGSSAWTLPWRPKGSHLLARLFTDLEEEGL